MPEGAAEPLGYGIVIGLITYLSIVIGELVPKQLALRNPESHRLRRGAPDAGDLEGRRPGGLAAQRLHQPDLQPLRRQIRRFDNTVTEEEIKMLVGEAESAGVIEEEERRMICGRAAPRRPARCAGS